MVDRRTPPAGKRGPPKKESTPNRRRNGAVRNSKAAAAEAELTPEALVQTDVSSGSVAMEAVGSTATSLPEAVEPVVDTPISPAPVARVFDVFLIDSGWNNAVSAAVRENLPAVAEYLKGHRFFVMNPDQSMYFVRRHPALVGADPMLLVLDRAMAEDKKAKSWGFRLCLGFIRQPEAAVSMLKWAVQLTMTASASEMATIISKSAHRETLQGVIELVGEGSTHLIEFAPL